MDRQETSEKYTWRLFGSNAKCTHSLTATVLDRVCTRDCSSVLITRGRAGHQHRKPYRSPLKYCGEEGIILIIIMVGWDVFAARRNLLSLGPPHL